MPKHRGIALLQANHPKAKAQADVIIKAIFDSGIKIPIVNFLVDGTFGYDFPRMMEYGQTLTKDGRKPIFEFYLLNGPAQRKNRWHYTDGFMARVSPAKFERLLLTDKATQDEIADFFSKFAILFEYLSTIGVTVYVCPMLEDNLSRKGFNKLLSISKLVLPDSVKYVRNPSSKDRTIPKGVLRETHDTSRIPAGAFITNDGKSLSFSSALSRAKKSKSNNSAFIWWDAKRQGSGHNPPTPIWKRKFKAPTESEIREIIRFLRG